MSAAASAGARPRRSIRLLLATALVAVTGALILPTSPAGADDADWPTAVTTSSASAPAGRAVTFTMSITPRIEANALADLEVYAADGRRVFQFFWDAQAFSPGRARVLTTTWAVPADQAPGRYVVKSGVFRAGWGELFAWNDTAATITVTAVGTPASTTTTTIRPTTTVPITAAPTTAPATTAPATTVRPTTTAPRPTPTNPPAGVLFSEDFSNPGAFSSRFDHNWSGEVLAGSMFGSARNNWRGDHDGNCGDPNATGRTITVSETPRNTEQAFYPCLPGNDPARGHLMTSVNTEGYVTAWFSPKQTFTNTRQVCWDQNFTFVGNGKWTQVVFLTAAEAGSNPDLGFTSPEFPAGGASTPRGAAQFGIKVLMADKSEQGRRVQVQAWQNGGGYSDFRGGDPTTTDKAGRYTICITDNENGTLTMVRDTVAGGSVTATTAGSIPNGPIRVVFEDDNYNPDKHHSNAGDVPANGGEGYTWHWDNIQIS